MGTLWFSPFENVFTFLIFALIVGIVQIISGIVLEGVNFALKHNIADALLTSLPKIGFFLGGVYLIAVYQLNFGAWFSGPILGSNNPVHYLNRWKTTILSCNKTENTCWSRTC